jgi:ParB family chromosome partitioning protein
MPRKTGLGRGLDALIPSKEGVQPVAGVIEIGVEQIVPNPRQHRTRFDADELTELAESIREHGVIQPLLVKRGAAENQYVLIAGQRRWLAASQAGLRTVPAIVREASEQQMVEMALVENIQRADLTPLEAAEAYRQLSEDFGLSHEEIARRVGKSRASITNTLRLLKLPPAVQQALTEGKISEGHARALLALPTPQAQEAALQSVLKYDLNVRQTEDLVRKMLAQRTPPSDKPALPAHFKYLEERLRTRLGTKVNLNPRGKGGTLVIRFYSDEELDALVRLILGED